MSLLHWTPDLNTGIDWVDSQHQQIVHHINELYDAKLAGDSPEQITEVIECIIQYTQYHFSEEEEMLESVGYALLHTHKAVHHGFVDKLSKILNEFKVNQHISDSLIELLRSWLFNHIRVHDKSYIATVKRAKLDHSSVIEI